MRHLLMASALLLVGCGGSPPKTIIKSEILVCPESLPAAACGACAPATDLATVEVLQESYLKCAAARQCAGRWRARVEKLHQGCIAE